MPQVRYLNFSINKKRARLQLDVLKSQLNPHFLFNSLNSLSALFQKDTVKAESFIRALAKCYQYTLDKHRDDLVPLQEELDFVKAYALLLRTRFGEGFQMKIDLQDGTLQSKIPPLTLQLLVENAVKHNVFNTQLPLSVSLYEQNQHLLVRNNKTGARTNISSTKIGLKNIKSRYQLITKRTISVVNEGFFEVKLPILP